MRKTAENSVIAEISSRYRDSHDDKERISILMEAFALTVIDSFVTDEQHEMIHNMMGDFFYPRNAAGEVDKRIQEQRINVFNQRTIEQRIAVGRLVKEYKERFDRDYPNAGLDDKKRDNNLLLAIRYAVNSAEAKLLYLDAMFKFGVVSVAQDEEGEEFSTAFEDNYQKLAANVTEKDLFELGSTEQTKTAYTEARFDESYVDRELDIYYGAIVAENPTGKRYLGDREFDPQRLEQFSAWHKLRNDSDLEKQVEKLRTHGWGTHKNSPLYQNILDAYDRMYDAKNIEEFKAEMTKLKDACVEYASKRNPIREEGKKRLEFVNELESYLSNSIIPEMEEKLQEPEPVVEDPFLKEVQAAVLSYELNYNELYNEIENPSLKQEMHAKIEQDILEDKNVAVRYIMMQPREVAEKMLEQMNSSDGSDRKHFYNLFTEWKRVQESLAKCEDPAGEYVRGMLTPKLEDTNMRNVFRYGDRFEEMPGLRQVQKEAAAIVLPVPKGLSEDDVAMITMSYLTSDDNMADSFVRASGIAGSTLFSASDAAEAGFANFIQNQLVLQDDRANMHLPRLYVPEARRATAEALHEYEKGNYAGVAASVKSCFDKMFASARATNGIADDKRIIPARFAISMYDLLSKPEFKDYVEFTEDEKEYMKLIKTEKQLMDRMFQLKKELIDTINEKSLQEEYLENANFNPPSVDYKLLEKYREYQALVLYRDRADRANITYDNAVATFHNVEEIPTNTKKADAMKNERPISRCQRNMLADPEGYINYLKREVGRSEDLFKLKGAKNWREAAKVMGHSGSLAPRDITFNVEYSESLGLVGALAMSTDNFPETKEAEALRDELLQLPCCKDPVGGNTLSPKEMNERADLYEKMIEKVAKHSFPYNKTVALPTGDQYEMSSDAAQDIVDALKLEVKCLRESSRLAVNEIAYEHAIAPSILSEGQVDQKIDEERQAVEEAANRIEEYRYGRPNSDIYRNMLVELVDKAAEETLVGEDNLQVIQGLSNCLGSPTESLLIDKMPAILETEMDKLSERMLDDDSPELMQEYSVLANVSSYLDAYMEASVIEEAQAEDSVYAKTYDNTGRRLNEIETVLSNINKETYPQFYELATRAKISINNIREAISNEAHGITTQNGVELGVAGLQNTDDLATLAAFYSLAYTRADSSARVVLEDKGADLFIHKVDGSHKMQVQKQDYNIQDLNKVMEDRKNFSRFLLGDDEKVAAQKVATTELDVVKDESPVKGV